MPVEDRPQHLVPAHVVVKTMHQLNDFGFGAQVGGWHGEFLDRLGWGLGMTQRLRHTLASHGCRASGRPAGR